MTDPEWTTEQRWADDETWYERQSTLTAAAGVHRIEGLTDEQLRAFEDRAETAIQQALQLVMNTIADRIGKIRTAAGRTPWPGCPYGFHDRHDGPCP